MLPLPATAGAIRTHCNHYKFVTQLPSPLIGVESDPVEPNDFERTVFPDQTVCTRIRLVGKDDTGLWMKIPGSRKVTCKLSVKEEPKDKDAKPPFGTFTITPHTPDPKE